MPLLLCYNAKDRASLLNAAAIERTRTQHAHRTTLSHAKVNVNFHKSLPSSPNKFLRSTTTTLLVFCNADLTLGIFFCLKKFESTPLRHLFSFDLYFEDRILFLLSFCKKTAAREVVLKVSFSIA